jgi:CRP/FNR family transcriptional regulator
MQLSDSKFTPPSCENCTCRLDGIFKQLRAEEVHLLQLHKRCRHYTKGEAIFTEGTRANGLFCISSGKVKIFKTGDEGRDYIVRLAGEGDIIGYRALISDEPYYASAVAFEPTSVCLVPTTDFNNFISGNPGFLKNLVRQLSHDLRVAEERMLHLAQKSVRERLADTLLLLVNLYGTRGNDHQISVELTREDIASLVGTATETTIRLLSDLKSEGIIATQGKKIMILNEKALKTIAG